MPGQHYTISAQVMSESLLTRISNHYYTLHGTAEVGTRSIAAGGDFYAYPFIGDGAWYNGMEIVVTSAAASGDTAVVGIYTNKRKSNGEHYPDRKLRATSPIDISTTGRKQASITRVFLEEGKRYWLVWSSKNSAGGVANSITRPVEILGLRPTSTLAIMFGWNAARSGTYDGTLPETFPDGGSSHSSNPYYIGVLRE